jgi:N6-adenosine-specific RNA methylase IME4
MSPAVSKKPSSPSEKKYGTVIADPPWPEYGGGKIKRGADRHYPLMKVEEIAALGPMVEAMTLEDAHLYLWITNNYLSEGLTVMLAWGFTYVTMITWYKHGRAGLGQYFRGVTEHVLFGRKGMPPYRTRADGKRAQGLTGFIAPRGEHSQKPPHIHDWAEQISPGPYLEMFARSRRKGWDAWGNEAPMTLEEILG